MRPPTQNQLATIAKSFGLNLSEADMAAITRLSAIMKPAYECLDKHKPNRLPVRYPREAGRAPSPPDNPYNAWAWHTDIHAWQE